MPFFSSFVACYVYIIALNQFPVNRKGIAPAGSMQVQHAELIYKFDAVSGHKSIFPLALQHNQSAFCDVSTSPIWDIVTIVVHCNRIPHFIFVVQLVFFCSVSAPSCTPVKIAVGLWQFNLNNGSGFD